MKFKLNEPPRVFTVGRAEKFNVKDCGQIELKPNEQITFKTESGSEYDVARKEWGYYATPSLNARLTSFGLRTALIKNEESKRYYIFLVEKDKEKDFQNYIKVHGSKLICWMDNDEDLSKIERLMK